MLRCIFACLLICASPLRADPFFEDIVSPQALQSFANRNAVQDVEAQNWMIAAANPLAVEAGARILRQGGTAADAMVAVQAVLGLVEPQSSGLGGGAFLVWYDAGDGKVTTLDGRETAPQAAGPDLFLDDTGKPLKFFDAVVGGKSVGVPATPALMQTAQHRWGRLPWSTLFDEALKLAQGGFAVSPRLADAIAWDADRLSKHPKTAAYFLPQGAPAPTGHVLRNPDYANTLRALKDHGAKVFRTGPLAQDIIATVQEAPQPGFLSAQDLALYQVKERPPVCVTYRGYDVCGMGPPSSGGLTVGQILKIIEPYDLGDLDPRDATAWRIYGDAQRLAFADRAVFMADSDFQPVPTRELIADTYLAERAKLLRTKRALPEVSAGTPLEEQGAIWGQDTALELPSTSHISIVDRYGNAMSMTTTIENVFGSRLMVGGFLLNNELTDFSFLPERDGQPVLNRVEGGKRPRSSMSPTIVLKDGKPVLVIGSPGGSRIIGFVAQTIVAHLDWGMTVQEAISMPRFDNRFGTYGLEQGTWAEDLALDLENLGYKTQARQITSGLHAIAIGATLRGGADPRREGIALGE